VGAGLLTAIVACMFNKNTLLSRITARLMVWVMLLLQGVVPLVPAAQGQVLPFLFVAGSSGAGGYNYTNSEAATIVANMSTEPTNARKGRIDTLVGDLKTAGVWDKLDALWVMAAHDAQAASINWMDPSGTKLTAYNSPTFTADEGYKGNGSSSYLLTGHAPADGPNLVTADTTIAAWVRSVATGISDHHVGAFESGKALRIYNSTSATSDPWRVITNGPGIVATTASNVATGLLAGSIYGGKQYAYLNGVEENNSSNTGNAPTTVETAILARWNGSAALDHANSEVSIVLMGAGLSATEHSDLYDALNTYMSGL
jgi:hypothetical protein